MNQNVQDKCLSCMHHRWGFCRGIQTDSREVCENWEAMPSKHESAAGLTFCACVCGMILIVIARVCGLL